MILSIIEQALIALPLILGAYLTLSLLKLPDFSLESAYLFGGVASFLAKDFPLPLILLASACGGILVGLTVSFLNLKMKIPYLLAAIITNGLFHGLTQYLLGTSMKSLPLDFSFPFLVALAIGLSASFALGMGSRLGMCFAIYGNNPLFFSHHKISGNYVVATGVAMGHGLAGISGFLFATANGFVDLTMGFGVILLCLTALIMGKMATKRMNPQILVPLAGILAYFAIQQLLLRIGLNLKYFNAFQALFILGVLFAGRKKHSLDQLGV
jgi:putative tryptophan/tyrosine transport system permease protein